MKPIVQLDTSLYPATLLKKILWHRCFSLNFPKFLRTTFFIKHLWCLLWNLDCLVGVIYKEGTQNFSKNQHFLPPDIYIYVCVSGVKKC